jgi:hypothetical protein
MIRRRIGTVIRAIGRAPSSRFRRIAARLDRHAPAVARRVRTLAGRLLTTVEPVTPWTARDVESRLLTMRVRVGLASIPPNVSVGVIVAPADPALLAPWLRSMRWQSHHHWTCIVVDDASHEDITATVEPIRLADSRIRLARHGARRGLSAARNTGLRLLDTDLVMMIDVDRPPPPTLLADAVAAFTPLLRDARVAGVYVGPAGSDPTPHAEGAASLPAGPVVLRCSVLDVVGWFDEGVDDADAWSDLLQRMIGQGFRFVPSGTAPATESAPLVADSRRIDIASSVDSSGHGAAAIAADLGFDVGRTGRLDRLHRNAGGVVLVSADLEGDARSDIADAAREGVRRGLASVGATGVRSFLIEDKIWRLGEVIADEIVGPADAMAASGGEAEHTSRRFDIDVLLVAESVADVGPLLQVAGAADRSLRIGAIDLELVDGDAGANEAWRNAGIAVVPYHWVVTSGTLPDAVIGCAPAGPAVRDLLSAAREAGSTALLVQVPGRPGTLPCSEGSDLDGVPVEPDEAARLLGSPPAGGRGARHGRGRWRGTDFSILLHAEDGPLDMTSVDRLAALRGRHQGETAVIIGNGPSLNETELELLTDAPTFGVNSIFLAADRLPRPITYYVVEDTSVFNENVAAIKAFRSDWKLFPAMYRPAFADPELDERTIFFRMNAGFYGRKTGTICHPRFSLDPTQRLFAGQSVTIINLQLAHWMGFRRVVLIGMDFSYTIPDDVDRDGALIISRSDDPNHFHPDYFGVGKSWKDPLLDRVLVNYHLADEVYRATGREIVNATVGGRLDVFPRLSLRDALDGSPSDGGPRGR